MVRIPHEFTLRHLFKFTAFVAVGLSMYLGLARVAADKPRGLTFTNWCGMGVPNNRVSDPLERIYIRGSSPECLDINEY